MLGISLTKTVRKVTGDLNSANIPKIQNSSSLEDFNTSTAVPSPFRLKLGHVMFTPATLELCHTHTSCAIISRITAIGYSTDTCKSGTK